MIPVFHLDLNVTIRLMTALNKKLFFILSVLIYYFIHISNDALLDSLNQKKKYAYHLILFQILQHTLKRSECIKENKLIFRYEIYCIYEKYQST